MSNTVLNQSKLLELQDRCGRLAFYRALIMPVIVASILMGLGLAAVLYFDVQDAATGISVLVMPGNTILWLLMIKPMTRRLHDIGLSERHLAWILPILLAAPFIPVSGPIAVALRAASSCASVALLAMVFWPGTNGPNRYGRPPA